VTFDLSCLICSLGVLPYVVLCYNVFPVLTNTDNNLKQHKLSANWSRGEESEEPWIETRWLLSIEDKIVCVNERESMCVCVREKERECVCVYCSCMRVCMCVCVCVTQESTRILLRTYCSKCTSVPVAFLSHGGIVCFFLHVIGRKVLVL